MAETALGLGGLQVRFYGEVMASISHEINNTLAIMREGAGLLADYAAAAEKGRAIDPARLAKLAARMTGGVERATAVVARMNRFAHSSDEPTARLDVAATCRFMSVIFGRLAERAGVELVWGPERTVELSTRPFLLECLAWRALQSGVAAAGQGGKLSLGLEPAPGGAALGLSVDSGADPAQGLTGPDLAECLAALGGELGRPGPGQARIFLKDLT